MKYCLILAIASIVNAGYILHLTDPHMDRHYTIGTQANCKSYTTGLRCCHKYNIGTTPERKASQWGDYHCDAPFKLLNLTLFYTAKLPYQFDYVFWTGDGPDHNDLTQSLKGNLETIQILTTLIKNYFPNLPVFPIDGNHDTWPIDQLSPYQAIADIMLKPTYQYWFDAGWLTATEQETFLKGGYYTRMLKPGLHVVGINSLYYDNNNLLNKKYDNSGNQTSWLESTLDSLKNSTVWLLGHIFPGTGEATPYFDNLMTKLLKKYPNIQSFWGHTHRDQTILYGNYSVGLVASSLVPDRVNPSVTIYQTDENKIVDKIVHYLDLQYLLDTGDPEFKFLYSARKSYGIDDLSVNSITNLTERLKNNQTLAGVYCNNFYVDAKNVSSSECEKLVEAIQYKTPSSY